jgi:hypothetical protein
MNFEGGGKSAAITCTLTETTKLNGVNPQACSPMSSAVSQITRSTGLSSCCLGTIVQIEAN